MNEHSKYYHDDDRNKPLPGVGSSEITALTEANKLLAAQVAGLADEKIKELAGALTIAYSPHVIKWEALIWAVKCLVKFNFDRAAKVSDCAADAPSEPRDIIALIEKAQKISPSMSTRCYELTPLQVAWVIGKSRAADALDSQPTETQASKSVDLAKLRDLVESYRCAPLVYRTGECSPVESAFQAIVNYVAAKRPTDDDLWDATLRDRDAYHEWADKLADAIAVHCGVDIGEHSNQNLPWAEALEAIESADCIEASSQPTDGEVRNG